MLIYNNAHLKVTLCYNYDVNSIIKIELKKMNKDDRGKKEETQSI